MKKAAVIFEAILLITVLQCIRELLEWAVKPLPAESGFAQRMTTMVIMIFLSAAVVFYARIRRTGLSVFPRSFGKLYVIVSLVSLLLLVNTPSNFTDGYQAILLLFYGSIVTPIYEELIFRGYLWNRLNTAFTKEYRTYIISVLLFTLWHIGYMVPQLVSGNWVAVLWKLAAGLGYGIVLGFVRLKTHNCYSTMLLHGVLNIFMV